MDPAYEQEYYRIEERHAWSVGPRDLVLSAMRRAGSRSVQGVLDVRCGSGLVVCTLQADVYDPVVGLDMSPEAVESASTRVIRGGRLGDGSRIEADDASFEHGVASDVLEHILDERSAPREWMRVLRPGWRLEPRRTRPAREAARPAQVGPLVVLVCLALAAGCGSDDGRTTDGGGAAADATDGAQPDQDAAPQADAVDGAAADADANGTPTPPPAREAGSCPDYAQLREGLVCTDQPSESGCGTDADCATGLCQPEFSVGSAICSCAPTACQSDAECGEDEACSCAVALPRATVLPTPTCGTGRDNECASRCLPAACRVDGDCAAGEHCAAHYDGCGNRLGFACWGADTAECGTPADCPAMNTTCLFNGEAWRCGPVGGICD